MIDISNNEKEKQKYFSILALKELQNTIDLLKNTTDALEKEAASIKDRQQSGYFVISRAEISKTPVLLYKLSKDLCEEAIQFLAMEDYLQTENNKQNVENSSESGFVKLYVNKDSILVLTPNLHKKYNPLGAAIANMLSAALRQQDLSIFNTKDGISIYIISVYPVNADSKTLIDPDNINTKSVTDILCDALLIDDNPQRVSYYLGAYFSDNIPPGMYTIFIPSKNSLDRNAYEIFKNVIKVSDFLQKK